MACIWLRVRPKKIFNIKIASLSNGLRLVTGTPKAAVSTAVFLIPKFRPNVKSTVSGDPARSDGS